MVPQRSESVCVDHWEIAEAPTSDHVDALRRKDESEDIFNELNGRQERICATQIHILVADRTRLLSSAYSTSLAAYEPSWPVNSNWLHVEVNFYGSVKRHS